MPASGLPPRRTAHFLLDRITGDGKLLSELIGGGALDRLPPEDRARAQRLTTETLRQLDRCDALIGRFVQKSPPLSVRNILRLGTWELAAGGAAHGVVNDWVEICARGQRTGRLKGLVNAVLRKVAASADEWDSLPAPRLPDWLRDPLLMAYPDRLPAIEAAHAAGAPLDLTARRDPAALTQPLGATLLPTGSLRLRAPGQVSALPGFSNGDWWVQDAAAALPARVLSAQPGEQVLDLCAAPGGKTLQLAAAGAEVTAVDLSESRLGRLHENLARTGLHATVQADDALEITQTGWDAILLDAPCSATGTIRRHPDLPHAKDGSEFGALIALQSQMLDHALGLLSPGGRLVFCTCSLLPDEGEVQIEEALARHKDLRADRDALALTGLDPSWITEEGGLRLTPDLWPEHGGMDGFYIACLRRD